MVGARVEAVMAVDWAVAKQVVGCWVVEVMALVAMVLGRKAGLAMAVVSLAEAEMAGMGLGVSEAGPEVAVAMAEAVMVVAG